MVKQFDIIIVGGGMIGLAMAARLTSIGLNIAVVEARPPAAAISLQMDLRILAINLASIKLLQACGVWQDIMAVRACPFTELKTWQQGSEVLQFTAADLRLPALGYMVETQVIKHCLWKKLVNQNNVTLFVEQQVKQLTQIKSEVCLTLDDNQQITASLVLGCDGADSSVRQFAGIGSAGWNYQQQCMLIAIATDFPQQHITWQLFAHIGSCAFLPFVNKQACLVWYQPIDKLIAMRQLSYSALKTKVIRYFPDLPGDFSITQRNCFSLTRMHAKCYINQKVVLLGDAAHSINPLAGQGVNLGFQDVNSLSNLIITAINQNKCWHDSDLLAQYAKQRRSANLLMQGGMDLFYCMFGYRNPLIYRLKGLGLKFANHSGPLKKQVLRYALGQLSESPVFINKRFH